MRVKIEFSSIFARYTGNETDITANGETTGECLKDVARRYPEFGEMILDKDGKLTPKFDVFLNGKSTYPDTMNTPVNDGDTLDIVMLIHGG